MAEQPVQRRDSRAPHTAQQPVIFNDSDGNSNTVADRDAFAQTLRSDSTAPNSQFNLNGSWYTFDPQAGFRAVTEGRSTPTSTRTYTSPGPWHFGTTLTGSSRDGGQVGARVVLTHNVTNGNGTLQVRVGGALVGSYPLGSDPQALPTQQEIDLGFVNVTDRRGLELGLQGVVQAFVQTGLRYFRIGAELGLGSSVSLNERFAVRLTDEQYRQAVANRMRGCTNPDGTPCDSSTMPPSRPPLPSEQTTGNLVTQFRTSLLAVAEFARIRIAPEAELAIRAESGLDAGGESGVGFIGGIGVTIPWGSPRYRRESQAAPVSDVNLGMIQSGNLVIPRSMIPAGATEYLLVHAHTDATRRTVPATGDITIPVSDLTDVTGIDFRDVNGRTVRTFRILDGFWGLAQAAATPTELEPGATHTGEGYTLSIMPSPVTRPPSVTGQVDRPITVAHLEATAELPATSVHVRVGTGTAPVVYGPVQETTLTEVQRHPQGGTDITIPRDTADGPHQIEIVVVRAGVSQAPIITRLDVAPAAPTGITITPTVRAPRTPRNQGTSVHVTPTDGQFQVGDRVLIQQAGRGATELTPIFAAIVTGFDLCIGGPRQTCPTGTVHNGQTDTPVIRDTVTITVARGQTPIGTATFNQGAPAAARTPHTRRGHGSTRGRR